MAPRAPHSASFRPGVSGNPGGSTKAEVAARRRAAELIYARTDGGLVIIDFAIGVLKGSEGVPEDCRDGRSRRWAANFLAERLWGRAPLVVELSATPSTEDAMPDMRNKSLAELQQLAAGGDDGPPPDVH
jgi:hypothetical protein